MCINMHLIIKYIFLNQGLNITRKNNTHNIIQCIINEKEPSICKNMMMKTFLQCYQNNKPKSIKCKQLARIIMNLPKTLRSNTTKNA